MQELKDEDIIYNKNFPKMTQKMQVVLESALAKRNGLEKQERGF